VRTKHNTSEHTQQVPGTELPSAHMHAHTHTCTHTHTHTHTHTTLLLRRRVCPPLLRALLLCARRVHPRRHDINDGGRHGAVALRSREALQHTGTSWSTRCRTRALCGTCCCWDPRTATALTRSLSHALNRSRLKVEDEQ
jgi:hypothetical protein